MNDINRDPPPLPANLTASDTRPAWQRLSGKKRRVLAIVAVLLGFALLAWLLTPKATRAPAGRFGSGGPMPVVTASARTGDMPITLIGLGTVTPLATVTVQSQISGQIMHIAFKEGDNVKAGDSLFLIDPRPYQVALEQAQGALARDKALLDNARLDLDRYKTLWSQDSIAEQQLATQKSLVAQDEGNVKADQGQIDAAKLNLVYCHIASPIGGRVGLQQVNVGNYVTPAEPNGLVVITQLQPITVVFTLPEEDIPPLQKQFHAGASLPVTAYDSTNTHQLATGTLAAMDSQIDTTTGTIRLKASFPNKDEGLFPQQFVNVVLLLDTLHGATLIPQAGVQRGAPGTYVYVVNADQTVSVRKVTLGPGDATNVAITQGLKPGESVVVDGADKLKDGAKVLVRQAAPGATPAAPGARLRPGSIRVRAAADTASEVARTVRADRADRALRAADERPARHASRTGSSMNPSRIFILRPVGTSLLMVAIMLAGIVAYGFLPLSALPQVDYPTIQVQTFYPGASPEVMTSSVTAPLEVQFGQMPGLNQMSSTSSGGASVITLQFSLNLSLDIAEQEVQAAINAAGNLLPSDLPAPPIYAKVNPADAPVLTLGVTSKTLPLTQLEDLADTRMAQKISQIEGVGLVSVSGGQRPAVRIIANVRALAAYGLNIDDLRTTISNANVNSPKGTLDGPARSWTINANDQIQSPQAYESIIVAYKNGNPVRLSDVADVVNGAENVYLAGWVNSTPGIILNIQRQPGANVIQVVDRIKKLLPSLSQSLPAAAEVTVLTDRTNTIRASVHDVEFELSLAVILVVLVIFLFLRSIPATVIPSLSVPLSLVGTLGAMYLLGFSLNNLSLMALTIATGFVVDDAIVMIENISRYIEEGLPPLEAALKGAGEIGFTIVSLTVSLIAVLIPLLFMGDVVGRLFHEFAITLAVTIVISAVVSLTLVPMLCAKLLRHHEASEEAGIARWANAKFQQLIDRYGDALRWVLDRQPLTLAVAIGTLIVTVLLYVFIPKGFFPVQDTGLIQAITEAPQAVSYADMARRQAALAEALLKDKDVVSLSSFIGVDGTNITLNSGRMLINLKPVDERSASASQVIRRLQKEIADVPGISIYMQPVQDLSIDTTVSRTQYQFVLEDANPAEFNTWVPKLVDRLQQLPQIEDVASDQENQGLAAYLTIDRATASRFGITPATVDNALYDAFGQRIVSTIFTQSNQYRVILQADSSLMASLDSLGTIYLPSSTAVGGQVPLSALVKVSTRTAPLSVDHLGQFPSTTVSFNLAQGAALGDAVDAIRKAEAAINMPASVMTTFQGAALAFQATLGNELFLIIAAIVTVYIVLGVLYESFIHPITILSTLPSAGVGALLALLMARSDLGVIGIIGIILLIGIVKKNAIMMIDFALVAEREQGMKPRDAIYHASLLRFRPILMTTMAALLGALPLMLGTGTGSELRHPLGITIVGGLILSQLLTLFTTPVIYLYFDRLERRVAAWGAVTPAASGSPAE